VGGRSPLLRTPLPRSDTAARTSFKDFCCAGCERSDSSKPALDTGEQPRYAGYQQKTDRVLPVIRLSRAQAEPT
jgi:hypothetical protein